MNFGLNFRNRSKKLGQETPTSIWYLIITQITVGPYLIKKVLMGKREREQEREGAGAREGREREKESEKEREREKEEGEGEGGRGRIPNSLVVDPTIAIHCSQNRRHNLEPCVVRSVARYNKVVVLSAILSK